MASWTFAMAPTNAVGPTPSWVSARLEPRQNTLGIFLSHAHAISIIEALGGRTCNDFPGAKASDAVASGLCPGSSIRLTSTISTSPNELSVNPLLRIQMKSGIQIASSEGEDVSCISSGVPLLFNAFCTCGEIML